MLPVAADWYAVDYPEPGIIRIREPHAHVLMRANVFLLAGAEVDILVDTGLGVGDLAGLVRGLTPRPVILFTTHAHLDHIGAHAQFPGAEVLVHPAEAALLAAPDPSESLSFDQFAPDLRGSLAAMGFDVTAPMIDALPWPGFDMAGFRARGVAPTRLVGEGDRVDQGDRGWEVLHLPGHSPGSIALWDGATGTLIAGDAVYDGTLIDDIPGASIPDYRATMARLRDLPVRIVHGGHNGAFGPARLREIAEGYLARRA